jgi:hypothetical protein
MHTKIIGFMEPDPFVPNRNGVAFLLLVLEKKIKKYILSYVPS